MVLGLTLLASPALGQSVPQSWTADRRDFAEGDVITVVIDEFTSASSNQGDFASDRRFRDLGVGASQTMAPMPDIGADVSTSNQAESRQSNDASRQNRFQGEMTVRVVAIEESGLLQVEGRKMVNIDKKSEEMVLRGFIRPQDVSPTNMINSWRIGDAELVYTTKGTGPKSGIIGRLLGMIWP
jgi:flagellar L-ring protein FlgH